MGSYIHGKKQFPEFIISHISKVVWIIFWKCTSKVAINLEILDFSVIKDATVR